ncbi:MAG TPA: hypothetical protein VJ739_06090 [Gemmataceae bacterium]|nr:hypothetical protein [Gemmataceae bacterium]
MDLTISLDEKQAAQLQKQASSRRLSAEQLARNLLGEALGKIAEEETWGALNRRRLELIGKARCPGLSAEETKELDQLQAAVDRRLEPMGRQLLATAEQFRRLAEGLADEPNP